MATTQLFHVYIRLFVALIINWARKWISTITRFPIARHVEPEKGGLKSTSGQAPTVRYRYSKLVDPSTYDDMDLCGSLPLRVHKFAHLADKGARRAQEDWKRLVGPIQNFTGCLSPRFNGIAVAIPECIPERLEVVTYANEFAFLHDDILDTVGREDGEEENNELARGFESILEPAKNLKMSASGKSQMQAKLILELLDINEPQAMVLLKSWEGLVKGESGTQHFNFQTLEDYLPHRVVNLGQTFWFGIITFAMGLTIDKDEVETTKHITEPAYATLALANDYFSWAKEYAEFLNNPTSENMANAIWIIMKEHSVDVEEAKNICREKIRTSCAEYGRRKREFELHAAGKASSDVLRYLSALEFSISGNVVWSQYTPRYNFHKAKKYSHAEESSSKSDDSEVASKDSTDSTVVDLDTNIASMLLSTSEGGLAMNRPRKTLLKPVLEVDLPELTNQVVLAPFEYVSSLPSKKVRHHAIDALNIWFNVPDTELSLIKDAIDQLHNASLMLDDIEDLSPLRRGYPSTHVVYGVSQTINSANNLFVMSLDTVQKLESPACLNIFIEELKRLHIGQSLDLHWTANVHCPTFEEYLKMVDYKTGGLFQMVAKLMVAKSPRTKVPDVSILTTLFGRYFQIRDDYQNLMSDEYTNQKGFCEDLDEGKFSLPLIHSLTTSPNIRLQSILQERRVAGKMSFELKKLVLEHLEQTKSLEYTKEMLHLLHAKIQKELDFLEEQSGVENFLLRLLLKRLYVK